MAGKDFIDMDIFSRRIGPYFTWLESKIESGWMQSDSVSKDVLKETRALATAMRARFILGITRDDFKTEVESTLGLFDLALDAFPDYSAEIEGKITHFTKGLKTELGDWVIPNGEALEAIDVEQPVAEMKPAAVKKVEEPKTVRRVDKVKKVKPAKDVEKAKKVERKPVSQTKMHEEPEHPVKAEVKEQNKGAKFSFGRWLRSLIYGED